MASAAFDSLKDTPDKVADDNKYYEEGKDEPER